MKKLLLVMTFCFYVTMNFSGCRDSGEQKIYANRGNGPIVHITQEQASYCGAACTLMEILFHGGTLIPQQSRSAFRGSIADANEKPDIKLIYHANYENVGFFISSR